MSIQGAVAELTKEIDRLTKIRELLLVGATATAVAAPKPVVPVSAPAKGKRTLSPAARKKISEANKARWAAIRKKEKATVK
ncbi:MAG: hypothetical protein ACYC46_11650 [Acidobacteriaceae bacterium]